MRTEIEIINKISSKYYKLQSKYYDALSKGIEPIEEEINLAYFYYYELSEWFRNYHYLYLLLPDDIKRDGLVNRVFDYTLYILLNNEIETTIAWNEYFEEEKKANRKVRFIPKSVETGITRK